jgi:DNA repair protein RadC
MSSPSTVNPAQLSFDALLFSCPVTPKVPQYFLVPVYGMRLFVQDRIALKTLPTIRSPRDVADLFWKHLQDPDRENFCVLMLDTKNHVTGMMVVSVGDLSSAVVHPREVFKAALLANAASIILAHNHPSNDPTPSNEDIAVTRRLQEAGELLGVAVLDHVIVGNMGGRFVSLKEQGCI